MWILSGWRSKPAQLICFICESVSYFCFDAIQLLSFVLSGVLNVCVCVVHRSKVVHFFLLNSENQNNQQWSIFSDRFPFISFFLLLCENWPHVRFLTHSCRLIWFGLVKKVHACISLLDIYQLSTMYSNVIYLFRRKCFQCLYRYIADQMSNETCCD